MAFRIFISQSLMASVANGVKQRKARWWVSDVRLALPLSWLLMQAGPRRQRQPERWCWVLGQAPPSQTHTSETWSLEMLSQGEVTWSPERRTGTEALLGLPLPSLLKILSQNGVLPCGALCVLPCGALFWVEFPKQKEYCQLPRAVSAL